MKKIIIASTNKNAGKTSIIVGLSKAYNKKIGYLKPLGDRLLYQKKRQWDYDSAIMTNLIGIQENSEDITIGFEHSKLKYMYDKNSIQEKLDKTIKTLDDRDITFIESGRSLTYGISVNLDAISLAKTLNAKLIVIASGNEGLIFDNLTFLKKYIDNVNIEFGGVILNKVHNKDEFTDIHLQGLKDIGLNILGIIPFIKELTYPTVSFIADNLFAKIITCKDNLNIPIKQIVVGAMSSNAAINLPVFKAESKLVITSGDRSDMILAAIETNSAAVLLTNNILPPANIVSQANDKGIPLLLIKFDTYEASKQLDKMIPLLTKNSTEKADMLGELIKNNINIKTL